MFRDKNLAKIVHNGDIFCIYLLIIYCYFIGLELH